MYQKLLVEKMLGSSRFNYFFEAYQFTICDNKLYAYNKEINRQVPINVDAYFYIPKKIMEKLVFNNPEAFGIDETKMKTEEGKFLLQTMFLSDPMDIKNILLANSKYYVGISGALFEMDEYILEFLPLDDFSFQVDLTEYDQHLLVLTFFHKDLV